MYKNENACSPAIALINSSVFAYAQLLPLMIAEMARQCVCAPFYRQTPRPNCRSSVIHLLQYANGQWHTFHGAGRQ